MTNRIAVSLGMPDTESCLASLRELEHKIGLAEIRLDLMQRYDLPGLIGGSPVPLIITCRAAREGGRFSGTEAERLAILTQSVELGCAYIDVEWDSVAAITERGVPSSQIIASQHWHDRMPADMVQLYERLRDHAHVVKLVGTAQQPADTLPIFALLNAATSPVIAIAMGEAGQLTRILAPCMPACFLTYGTAGATLGTAVGQLTVDDLYEGYRLQHVGAHTTILLHLCVSAAAADAVRAQNQEVADGTALHVPMLISVEQATALIPTLRSYLPRLDVVAGPDLPAEAAATLAELR